MSKVLTLCDVDSTLTDSEKVFADIAVELGIPWKRKASWWFQPQDAGVSREVMSNMFRKAHSRDIFMQQKPYGGSREVLRSLADNLDIWYVSNRHPQAQSTLEEWIGAQDYPQAENVLAIKDKRVWIEEKRPTIVIDDRVATMIFARDLGIEVFSLKHNHNVNLSGGEVSGIHICDDWWDLGIALQEFLGLR